MKNVIWVVIAFLFTACQTTDNDNFERKQRTYFKTVIEHACFARSEGSFAAVVSSTQISSITWEGKWTNNFSQLKTQLIDPIGNLVDSSAFSKLEASLGARGLRSIMCGQASFRPYIRINDHKIKIKTKIANIYHHNDQTFVETRSEFYYGLFSKKSQNTLIWKGRFQNGKVTPMSINFGSADELVSIDITDYE